jgi:hypothetical protein
LLWAVNGKKMKEEVWEVWNEGAQAGIEVAGRARYALPYRISVSGALALVRSACRMSCAMCADV